MDEQPIFVTGFPRSGTTLLGNIIDRHPRIGVFVESFFIPRYYYLSRLFWPLSREKNRARLVSALTSEPAALSNGLRCSREIIGDSTLRTYPDVLNAMMSEWARQRGKERWGDKSPGYVNKMDILRRLYPRCKVVHIIRDGRDAWLSLRKLRWETNVVHVARAWEGSIRKARKSAAAFGRGSYIETRYEDLIKDTGKEMRRIIGFLGEEYDDRLLDTNSADDRNQAFMKWPKINDTVNSANFDKWRTEMNQDEIALFECQSGGMLRELDYATTEFPASARTVAHRLLLLVAARIQSLGRALSNRTRYVANTVKYLAGPHS